MIDFIKFIVIALQISLVFVSFPGLASEIDTPFNSKEMHLGVATCASSTCHGSLSEWVGSNVLQNEFVTWQESDPHARSFKTLLNKDSKRIARNLGLANAHEADMCLDCHADNVATTSRGPEFQISDGVGCEACHGGAANWISVHVSGNTSHAKNIDAGLFPTDQPVPRARLCLSCHLGTENQFITHRIMGAGHPRLAFELDTYTSTQPSHYNIDSDYQDRKGKISSINVWAVGQAVAVNALLENLLDANLNKDGIFPELVFFDCHSCHHPMSDVRWIPRKDQNSKPGIPRLYDSNMVMLRVLTSVSNPMDSALIEDTVLELHSASSLNHDSFVRAADQLLGLTSALPEKLSNYRFTPADIRKVLFAVLNASSDEVYADYSTAEQAGMALSAIFQTMLDDGLISQANYANLNDLLDSSYKNLKDDEKYSPRKFASALRLIKRSVQRL